MKKLTFYGYSDDLFEVDDGDAGRSIPGGYDEIDAWEKHCAYKVLSPSEGGLLVYAYYAPFPGNAEWVVGIAPIGENVPIPEWYMEWSLHKRGYSPELKIEVPDDTVVSNYNRGEEDD